MTTALPSEVKDFLTKSVRLPAGHVQWIEERYEKILAGDSEDWYITFLMQQGNKRRKIEAPEPTLKAIQRRILDRVIYRFGVSKEAHGFVRGRSPVTNAITHLKHRETLKDKSGYCALMIDVKDFFHGINDSTVWKTFNLVLLRRTRITDAVVRSRIADILTGLCTKDGRLPMGAPTSPALSNLAMIPFDRALSLYSRRHKLCYTRYADDIVVSGPRANKAFKKLEAELDKVGLVMNAKKTRVRRPHRALDVTGVTINSGEPTVSRRYRRALRAAIHNTQLFVEGAFTPLAKDPRPEQISRLLGRAGWCAFVNPKHAGLRAQAQEVQRLWEDSD